VLDEVGGSQVAVYIRRLTVSSTTSSWPRTLVQRSYDVFVY
jgi:hypothetical protein